MPDPIGAVNYNDIYGGGVSGPAYPRVNAVPPWLPDEGTQALQEQYRGTNAAFDTTDYERANRAQQGRVLTTALNAGTAAAAEYAARARQAGGSGLGAGLIKAQAQTGAQSTAGALDLQRAQYVNQQREAAATHATQIAQTLGELRQTYLKNIVDYATNEDRINAEYDINRRRLRADAATGRGGPPMSFNATIGPGIDVYNPGRTTQYNNMTDYFRAMGQAVGAYDTASGRYG